MLERFKALFDQLSGESATAQRPEAELRLAAAALMVHAAAVDGAMDEHERDALDEALRHRFDLPPEEARDLIEEAGRHEREAVDLYRFTSVLTRQLDQDGRQKIVGMLWEIVYADGQIHEFEANLVWRVAELLGVSTRDRVRLRKQVEGGAG